MIAIQSLTVRYPNNVVALADASFEIPRGALCAVVGMNGAGKSTLFKAILGLAPVQSGVAIVDDLPSALARKRGMIAYMPQTETVDWDFPITVRDVVLMGRYGHMGFLRTPTLHDQEVVEQALETVGMSGMAGRQIGELSGGQRKRVFLARALAQEADVLLLDEPFAGVDYKTEEALTQLLSMIQAQGKTILISLHELTSVSTHCDHVVLVRQGIVAAGPTNTTFTHDNVKKTFDGVPQNLSFDHVTV